MTHRVFICYSSLNREIAEAARDSIEALKIPCWMAPRDVPVGENWGALIIKALEACQVVVVIFSRDANESPQVQREVERAISKRKTLLLFRIEDALPSDALELGLSITHWLDAFQMPITDALFELGEAATRLLRKQSPEFQPTTPETPHPRRQSHQSPIWKPAELPPLETLWPTVQSACQKSVQCQVENKEQSIGKKYQRRAIEDDFAAFIESSAKGMFIIGDSGVGKTTLLIQLQTQYQSMGHLCMMYESRTLPTELTRMAANLVKELAGPPWVPHPDRFWSLMDSESEKRVTDQNQKRRLLVFIDAVNEFSQDKADPRPVHLLDTLDGIIQDLDTPSSNVKFVITCRPETWRRATDNAPTRFRKNPGTYFSPKGTKNEIAWKLLRFTDQEFAGAYENYRAEKNILTPFERLSPVAVYHLRDPLLLDLASKAYANQEIPRELDTGTLFESYFKNLRTLNLAGTIDGIVSEMFVGDDSGEAITRTSFRRDSRLATRNSVLYTELDFSNDLQKGAKLKEQNVIREWREKGDSGDQSILNIRFTYDRFAEYLLSNRLQDLVLEREKLLLGEGEKQPPKAKHGNALAESARTIVSKNLASAQKDPVVYAALQRTLYLLRKRASSYVAVLKTVSEIDARGQWLVISVLARTARQQSGGIQLLADLLRELGKGKSSSGKRFPLVESVYRVLRDEDYRLWLEEQDDALKNKHLSVLYQHFVHAFQEKDANVWNAGVQYLFFLWKSNSEYAYIDAKNITQLLSAEVRSAVGIAPSGPRRRMFRGFAVLMILVLSEAPADRFAAALEVTGAALRRLKLKKLGLVADFLVDSFLLQIVVKTLEQLPNPIQMDSLVRYYENRDAELPIVEEVLELLDPDCDPSRISLENLKRLAETNNSYTVQMMTFVVSANYERAVTNEAKAKALDLARNLFYEEPRSPIAEYCASLSLYHINYFGSHATEESMALMGQMADSILAEREGHLEISGKRHNFNIIGTYGRSLHKFGEDIDGSGAPDPSAMRYVITSLQAAREAKNSDFYAYICREVGLLGVLVEPRYLFDVFTSILKDLNAVEEKAYSDELPFKPDQVEKLTDTILQSLANIRVLYRQQVDKYLLEVLESPEIYADVATKREPDFQLSFFVSWAFEQLMFRTLVYYHDEMGKDLLKAFLDSMRCSSPSQSVRVVLSAVVRRCAMLSE